MSDIYYFHPAVATEMITQLAHKTLDLYALSKKLVYCSYELSQHLPAEEKTNLTRHLREASLTVHINVAQGAFLKSRKKRKKFVRSAQNALIIMDAVIEALLELRFITEDQTDELARLASQCYQLLDGLLKK